MNDRIKEKLSAAAKNKTLLPTIFHALNRRWPIRRITDESVLDRQLESEVYKKLKKQYASYLDRKPPIPVATGTEPLPRKIWWCWFQGVSGAPELVKACLQSLYRELSEFEVTVITEDNMTEYADLPDAILEKYKKKFISRANFSDYLRTALLMKHGGLWLDSTVYCTGNEMVPILDNTPLFFYKDFRDNSVLCSSWMIAARPRDPLLTEVLELLTDYWCHRDVAEHYYIYHIIVSLLAKHNAEYWDAVPLYENMAPHVLIRDLNREYCAQRLAEIKRFSSFHKLNYKQTYSDSPSSFYQRMLNGEL